MAEVRKYFCCTDNLTGCKIIGGIQIALNAILLIFSVVALNVVLANSQQANTGPIAFLAIFLTVPLGLMLLCAILLVVAANKRSATMLMVWIILNGIGIAFLFFGLFFGRGDIRALIPNLITIGIALWAELIAIGAREEVKSGYIIQE